MKMTYMLPTEAITKRGEYTRYYHRNVLLEHIYFIVLRASHISSISLIKTKDNDCAEKIFK